MNLYVIQHVPFEGPGTIAEWAQARGHRLTTVDAPAGEVPTVGRGDLLVVTGGPMGANDDEQHPWLVGEISAINAALDEGVLVFGVCLGAQLLARALGAAVTRNPEPEVGWYEVERTPAAASDPVFSVLPERFVAGHWHGDTFGIPDSAVRTLGSAACANQAFSARGGRAIGLQCHLEWRAEDATTLVERCGAGLVPARWVADGETFLAGERMYGAAARRHLWDVLDAMVAGNG